MESTQPGAWMVESWYCHTSWEEFLASPGFLLSQYFMSSWYSGSDGWQQDGEMKCIGSLVFLPPVIFYPTPGEEITPFLLATEAC